MSDKLVVDLHPDKHRHCSEDKGDGTDPSLYNFADEQFCPHGPVPFSHVSRYVNRTCKEICDLTAVKMIWLWNLLRIYKEK